jgi:enterochelin esterase-like enzyme
MNLLTLNILAGSALAQERPDLTAEVRYQHGPDSQRHEGVPHGEVTEHVWKDSQVFPGTIRRYYVYVPAQYDAARPAALMVFQDGHAYISETGDFRVPVVFDNLIHRGEMPVTIGVFVDPGFLRDELPPERGWRPRPENRSVEYDTLSDAYASFLLTELLPQVGRQYNITDDPERRAICGISSGGICAFTVAWERPDRFRKVLSHVGPSRGSQGASAPSCRAHRNGSSTQTARGGSFIDVGERRLGSLDSRAGQGFARDIGANQQERLREQPSRAHQSAKRGVGFGKGNDRSCRQFQIPGHWCGYEGRELPPSGGRNDPAEALAREPSGIHTAESTNENRVSLILVR